MDHSNILWICTDRHRFDTIHALGDPHIHTANRDRLAAADTAFTHASCQSPIWTPSCASFLTGIPTEQHQTTWCADRAIDFFEATRGAPGLFSNLWSHPGRGEIRFELMRTSFDALAAAVDPGPPITGGY